MTDLDPMAVDVTTTLAAPVERVWQAFTDPASLDAWLWPQLAATAEIDLRVGGRYRITAAQGPTPDFGVSGEYVEVKPPYRLSFTWQWPGEPEQTLVTVDLSRTGDAGGQTRLTLVHERNKDAETRENHRQGWVDCLDRLPGYLAG